MRILFGILLIALGVFIILKTEWILSFAGRSRWAEEKLGTEGGSRIFYKLIGLGLILLGFLLMSGGAERVLDFIFIDRLSI